jgi:hypothetical protein
MIQEIYRGLQRLCRCDSHRGRVTGLKIEKGNCNIVMRGEGATSVGRKNRKLEKIEKWFLIPSLHHKIPSLSSNTAIYSSACI